MEFLAEFLVHEVTSALPYIAKPALAIRLMDFPTLIIDGRAEERLVFGKGKACKFKLDVKELRQALQRLPLYVMLMDVYAPNIKMLATAALDLSVFAEGPFPKQTQFRRSRVDLFDPVRNPVAKVDISISFLQIPDATAEVTAQPPDSIFKTITEEEIRKSVRSPRETTSMGVGTDPLPQPVSTKVTFSKGTMTQEPETGPCSVQTETSVFRDVYQPPPMFLSKPYRHTPREVPREQSLPVQPRPQIRPSSREGLIEDLISELVSLKERSKVPSLSYPPVMQFEQKPTSTVVLSTHKVANIDIVIPPHFDQSPIATNRSKESLAPPAKASTEEYSDDFEEDRSSSLRTSQSTEQTIRCYLCGEVLKISEAAAHTKRCKKSRLKESVSMSPRSSIEEQIESSHLSRGDKSLSQTSMIQEYEEDFEEASGSQK